MVVYTGTPLGDVISGWHPLSPFVITNPLFAGRPSTEAADSIRGNGGGDLLDGGINPGAPDTILGGGGNDTIRATAQDLVLGGPEDDLIYADGPFSPSTSVDGGSGSDTLSVGFQSDLSAGSFSSLEVLLLNDDRFGDTSTFDVTLDTDDLDAFGTLETASPGDFGELRLASGGDAAIAVRDFGVLRLIGSDEGEALVVTSVGATATDLDAFMGEGADSLLSGAGDDTLRGEGGGDTLKGGAGEDTLEGGEGADSLDGGGEPGDSLAGGEGNDTLGIFSGTDADGGPEDDTLLVEEDLALTATLNGGPGTDMLDPQGERTLAATVTLLGIERLALDAATLTLTAAQLDAFDTIVADGPATLGRIDLRLGGGAIVEVTELDSLEIAGSGGADLLFLSSPGTTAVDFDGGLGDDLANLTGAAGGHLLAGAEGDDTLDGGDGAGDTLDGGADADLIFVGAGDVGRGGEGDDRLRLGAGVTLFASGALLGGEGEDTLEAPDADATIGGGATLSGLEVLALGEGRLALRAAALDGFDTIVGKGGIAAGSLRLLSAGAVQADVAGLETLTVIGSGGADELLLLSGAAGTEADITVLAGGGDDTVSTEAGDDRLEGGPGADALFGSAGIDTLLGGIGADSLVAMDGDSLEGGEGDDTLLAFGDLGPGTVLDGGADNDSLDPLGSFTFSAGLSVLGVERLVVGGVAAPVLSAEVLAAIPTIAARAGATEGTLALGDAAAAATVEVTGLASLRVLGAAEGDDLTFTSAATAITVEAGEGGDAIATGDGDDLLEGEGGEDDLDGGAGADTLAGGAGEDTLRGGGGADVLRYGAPGEGADDVRGFVPGADRIEVSEAGFGGGLLAGVPLLAQQLVVHASGEATAPAGLGQFVFDTTRSLLLWDGDGTGAAAAPVALAELRDVTALATGDFLVVA